jgi:uncharacterized Zn finger protein (UPF0148 family)
MQAHLLRLGDLIDDYCPRCKLVLNHNIASFREDHVAKVICRTCFTEHPYLHSKGIVKKKKPPKARPSPFEQVLAKVSNEVAAAAPVPAAPTKRAAAPVRYISRHSQRPPRGER